jgi:spermidine synthase
MWKTFAGRCLYQSSQGIRVFQNLLFRWLQFDSLALQTVLNRYAPHRPELRYIKSLIIAVQLQPQTCCMLGLGGGGAAHALSPILKDQKLDIIEDSAEVIEVAKRFFMIDRLQNIAIIQDEASNYIKMCSSKYQHILIDLYTAHGFPSQCNNEEFFVNCKKALKPGGVLAVNLANAKEHFPLFQLIQKQFGRATIAVAVPGTANLIIFAKNSTTIDLFLNLLKKNGKIRQLTWTEIWGYVATLR